MRKLVFRKPAMSWDTSLPAGNGKTAFVVSGGERIEILWFNDAELWSGYPKDHDNDGARSALKEARELIFQGKTSEADAFVKSRLDGDYSEAFMPLATVKIRIIAPKGEGYRRELDFNDGMISVEDDLVKRRAFVSYPHKTAVYSVESKIKFSLDVSAKSVLHYVAEVRDGVLTVSGNAPDYAAPNYLRTKLFPVRYNEKKASAFCLALKADTDGEIKICGRKLHIDSATYVRIYAVTETGFRGYDKMPCTDTATVRNKAIEELAGIDATYEEIEKAHICDYRALYGRQKITLAEGDGDVEKLLKKARYGNAPAELINLLYDFGKYMTVCGSRNSQPLNLQGQWNKSVRPPWSSNLTTNINAQMNYWGATRCGLEDCMAPFYRAVKETVARGRKTAEVNFGARGFCCNHNLDIWRNTSPVKGDPCYMYSPLCGAWLANEMFAHKKNSGKTDEDTSAVIEEAAKFCLDYLCEYEGKLVTCPSTSPETAYIENGRRSAVGIASAYEMSVIRQTFENCLQSGADESVKSEIKAAMNRLYPYEKAENGLAEWAGGKMSSEKGHRHFSPLYGVYPGNVIKEGTKEFGWAKELFLYRLKYSSSAIGWSAAWAICLAGRFKDGTTAKKVVNSFAAKSVMDNLFDFHPPCYFQIDGNMGFVAGINELLLSECDGVITLLPACFDTIDSGEMKGAVVNGTRIDFNWRGGKVVAVSADKKIRIKNVNFAENAITENVEMV